MDFFNALATLLAACIAILLFYWERDKRKVDIARIILQEIRRAEAIMGEYIEHREWRFTKKIIATDSWSQNIHFFVRDLDQDQIDKISTLYSTGKYIDSVIKDIADWKFKRITDKVDNSLSSQSLAAQSVTKPEKKNKKDAHQKLQIQITESPFNALFDDVIRTHNFIYDSYICRKLKEIADL